MASKKGDPSDAAFELEVLEQGIPNQRLSLDEAKAWIDEERSRWSALTGFPDSVEFGTGAIRVADPRREYDRWLEGVLTKFKGFHDAQAAWTEFLDEARALRIVLMQGEIGRKVTALTKQNELVRATYLVLAHSEAVTDRRTRASFVDLLRSVFIDAPSQSITRDLVSVEIATKSAAESMRASKRLQAEMEVARKETEGRLQQLEAVYFEKLLLEGPSRHWGKVSEQAGKAKRFAFVAFCVLLALPALAAVIWFNALSAFILDMVTASNGQFSVTSIVSITVPVLAYAWLLKHVSRSYIHNSAIETDARHRRIMAVTFLGLAKRKTVSLGEADRALILNALFRPAPPHVGEDGPPIGLAEFLRTK